MYDFFKFLVYFIFYNRDIVQNEHFLDSFPLGSSLQAQSSLLVSRGRRRSSVAALFCSSICIIISLCIVRFVFSEASDKYFITENFHNLRFPRF